MQVASDDPRQSRPPTLHRAAGLAVRGGLASLRRLPSAVAYAIATACAIPLTVHVLVRELRVGRRGRGVFRNQRIVFRGALRPARARRLLYAWARHTTWLIVDFARIPRIRPDNYREFMTDRKAELALREILAEGRGLLCVTGHIGSWEVLSHLSAVAGFPVTVVARPLGIGPIDDAVASVRSSGGVEIVSKWRVLLALKRALERGRMVGLAADENAGSDGLFVPFLGTRAATHAAPAYLHRATGAPLAIVTVHRVGRERYAPRIWDVIRATPTADRDADLRRITETMNAALSRAILAHPEQWMWGTRRFATRPDGEVPGPDGLPPRAAPPTRSPSGSECAFAS